MNPAYKEFLALQERERGDIFNTVAEELGTLGSFVEKDFWVCLALDHLFNGLPEHHPDLSFKGGTSLSKVFNLIRRFSEDIDITVSREMLGFVKDRDPTASDLSKRRRQALIDELRSALSRYVQNDLKASLKDLAKHLSTELQVETDETDPDNATLLLSYEKLMSEGSPEYVKSQIVIEMGARAAQEPSTEGQIAPFIARAELPMDLSVGGIRTILAERTFWEKVLILHGWQSRFQNSGKSVTEANRAARHYYDVATLSDATEGQNAIKDFDLLDRVREHSVLMFPAAWKKYDQACPSTFALVPKDQLRDDIERDYVAMQGMMLDEQLEFGELIERIDRLEAHLNSKAVVDAYKARQAAKKPEQAKLD